MAKGTAWGKAQRVQAIASVKGSLEALLYLKDFAQDAFSAWEGPADFIPSLPDQGSQDPTGFLLSTYHNLIFALIFILSPPTRL